MQGGGTKIYYLIKSANDTNVNWMMKIKQMESIAIQPHIKMVENKHLFWFEPCKPHKADSWFVEGFDRDGYIEFISDFPSKAEALSAVKKILATYPHLKKFGIAIKTRLFFKTVLKSLVLKISK